MIKITDREFLEITEFIKKNFGINLANKRVLLESRLMSLLQEKGLTSFSEYIKLVKSDATGTEVSIMLNKVTTNHTYFMREPNHFVFLKNKFMPQLEKNKKKKEVKVWSAGCSMGAEAYTIAMTLQDYLGFNADQWKIDILATDIAVDVLEKAMEGTFREEMLRDVSDAWKKRYFNDLGNKQFQVQDKIKKNVTFKKLNLMSPFTFREKFDIIFCRNVMIYFDQPTVIDLVNRYYDVLEPGGYFIIGHTETVPKNSTKFVNVMPSVYQKL